MENSNSQFPEELHAGDLASELYRHSEFAKLKLLSPLCFLAECGTMTL